MSDIILHQDDRVYYTGTKFKQELCGKEGKPHIGYIHAPVVNNPRAFVVEFPDVKGEPSYVMDISVLSKARPVSTEKEDVEVRIRKPRRSEED